MIWLLPKQRITQEHGNHMETIDRPSDAFNSNGSICVCPGLDTEAQLFCHVPKYYMGNMLYVDRITLCAVIDDI